MNKSFTCKQYDELFEKLITKDEFEKVALEAYMQLITTDSAVISYDVLNNTIVLETQDG